MKASKNMVRKQIYIQSEQADILKEQAERYGTSEGRIIRDALELYLGAHVETAEINLGLWLEELEFIQARSEEKRGDRIDKAPKVWKRDEIYERRSLY